jgi:hypothetical protein
MLSSFSLITAALSVVCAVTLTVSLSAAWRVSQEAAGPGNDQQVLDAVAAALAAVNASLQARAAALTAAQAQQVVMLAELAALQADADGLDVGNLTTQINIIEGELNTTLDTIGSVVDNLTLLVDAVAAANLTAVAANASALAAQSAVQGSQLATLLGTLHIGWSGTIPVAAYANGQLLVGNSVSNNLTLTTLTAGLAASVGNGPGASITVGVSGAFDSDVSALQAQATLYGRQLQVLLGTLGITWSGLSGSAAYGNGQLLVGTSAGGSNLTLATLAGSAHVTVTNQPGAVLLDTASALNANVSALQAHATLHNQQIWTLLGTLGIGWSGMSPVATYADGQLLVGTSAGGSNLTLATLTGGAGVAVTNGPGASVTLSASPALAANVSALQAQQTLLNNQTWTLLGTLKIPWPAAGPIYTDGQVLIGNTASNNLTLATLTAGAGVVVTNQPGAVLLDRASAVGAALTALQAQHTLLNNQTWTLLGTLKIPWPAAGPIYSDGQVLIGNTAANNLTLTTLAGSARLAATALPGAIVIDTTAAWQANTSALQAQWALYDKQLWTLLGTLKISWAGMTGSATYPDGALLIGDGGANNLTVALLAAGANVSILFTPPGTINISSSGGGSSAADALAISTLQAQFATFSSQTWVLLGTAKVPWPPPGAPLPGDVYADGELLVGSSAANNVTRATLTAGANATVVNGAGSITIGLAPAFATNVTALQTQSARYNQQLWTLLGTLKLGWSGQNPVPGAYANGQVLIGDAGANNLTLTTLTASGDLAATVGPGTVALDTSGAFQTSVSALEAQHTLLNNQTWTLLGTLKIPWPAAGPMYTDGQLLVGNTASNNLTLATLTQGLNANIVNGAGSITVGVTSTFDAAVSALQAQATLLNNQTWTMLGTLKIPWPAAGPIYSDGQVLIGNTGANNLTLATLAGSATVSVTNLPGGIALDTFAAVGASLTALQTQQTLLNNQTWSILGTLGLPWPIPGTGVYSDGQLLIGNGATSNLTKATLTQGLDVSVSNGAGSISVGVSPAFNTAVTTLQTQSTLLNNQTWTLLGTLKIPWPAAGTIYTNGQVLIGSTASNNLTKATLTAGTNMAISNGAGSISVGVTSGFDTAVTTLQTKFTMYNIQIWSILGTIKMSCTTINCNSPYSNGKVLIGNAGNLTHNPISGSTSISVSPAAGSITLTAAVISRVVFTSGSGTWTIPNGAAFVRVTLVGGGGGGGTIFVGCPSCLGCGGGGGSGAAIEGYMFAVGTQTSIAYVVGAGGGSYADGAASSVTFNSGGSALTAYGGGAGSIGANVGNQGGAGGGGGGSHGAGSAGDFIGSPGAGGSGTPALPNSDYMIPSAAGGGGGTNGVPGIMGAVAAGNGVVIGGGGGGYASFGTAQAGIQGAAHPKNWGRASAGVWSASGAAGYGGKGGAGVANSQAGISACATCYGAGGGGSCLNTAGSGGSGAGGLVVFEYF